MKTFNEEYYRLLYPGHANEIESPLVHYIKIGWKKGYNPSPVFNTNYYIQQNPEIVKSGLSPLEHYEMEGMKKKLNTFPALNELTEIPAWLGAQLEDILYYRAWLSGLFDPEYYQREYPDIGKLAPLAHYRVYGWKEKRRPAGNFDPDSYAKIFMKGDVSKNPILNIFGSFWQNANFPNDFDQNLRMVEESGLFDTDFYCAVYPDISERHALAHYLAYGWQLGYDPSPRFNGTSYRLRHPDSKGNPLIHYLSSGSEPADLFAMPSELNLLDMPEHISAHIGAIVAHKALKAGIFDAEWYLRAYPDIKDMGAMEHYRKHGWREGRNPGGDFNCERYARLYLNPGDECKAVWHFLFNSNYDMKGMLGLMEENRQLLLQLHNVQAELEATYLRMKDKQNAKNEANDMELKGYKERALEFETKYNNLFKLFNDHMRFVYSQNQPHKTGLCFPDGQNSQLESL